MEANDNESTVPAPSVPTRTPGDRASDVTQRLQHLRNLLHSERHQINIDQRRALDVLDREMLEMPGEAISARLDRRRRGLETQLADRDTSATSETPPPGGPLTSLLRRRRVIRPSERLQRYRDRVPQGEYNPDAMEETAISLGRPPPPVERADIAVQEYASEAQLNRESRESRWRAKRRKLDDGSFEEEAKTFSYGYKGQVVPGPLRLEIGSCDGGEYSEPQVGSSWPQHVLQDDSSVYCTKSNRCNMLLKHVGGMPFSLTKLVIKAPKAGYDAPIQEGMIFVAMNDDKLLEKTSLYEIRYSPRRHRYHARGEHNHIRFDPSREYLNSVRSPLRSIDRSSYLRDPYPPLNPEADSHYNANDGLEVSLIPGFQISTAYDNPSDHEDGIPPSTRRMSGGYYQDSGRPPINAPLGFSDYWRPTYADTDNDNGSVSSASSTRSDHRGGGPRENLEVILDRQRRLLRSMRMQQANDNELQMENSRIQDDFSRAYHQLEAIESEFASHRRSRPSRIEVRSDSGRADTMTATPTDEFASPSTPKDREGVNSGGNPVDVLSPHARFFIPPRTSSVSIRFDPPVAGRFILIKLWAPCPNANIDIQSIVAHGFGGPRFFPAYEPH